MSVARNKIKNPKLVPRGGATELTFPYEAASIALGAVQCALVIQIMTTLQGKHANGENAWIGIDENTGAIADMKEQKIWDAYNLKAQTFKTAIEIACMLLRIDDI
ncbi:Chaperonin Cpn60/GroEL/TCP-1 family - like 5, partial [Theobroma cacao]